MLRARLTLICAPLIAFALVWALPYGSARLSLLLHGHPFARIVPKNRLNIFEFVPVDNFRAQAIVFSREHAIGFIDDEMSSFPKFVRFSPRPNFDSPPFDPLFDVVLLLLYAFKWWWRFTGLYAVLFVFLFMLNRRRHLTNRCS